MNALRINKRRKGLIKQKQRQSICKINKQKLLAIKKMRLHSTDNVIYAEHDKSLDLKINYKYVFLRFCCIINILHCLY